MVEVLADLELYTFTGGEPPGLEELEMRYLSQVSGPSKGDEFWHNWIIRLAESGTAVGFTQATVAGSVAEVAWVVGLRWQSRGYAAEAAAEMCWWLLGNGVDVLTAHIHPEHEASAGVARSIGLIRTDEIDDEGEVVWVSSEI
jgi:RimJ/RimL family protein N-acetyltransferase